MGFLDRILGKKNKIKPVLPSTAARVSPDVPKTAAQATVPPICSLCGRPLRASDPMRRYSSVMSGPSTSTLYHGVVCTNASR